MEGAKCEVCSIVFSEMTCVPKVLECGHTICFQCLEYILQNEKICPNCKRTLSKSLEEYPTNIVLLMNQSSNKSCVDYQQMNSLIDKVNLIVERTETFKNSIEENINSLMNEFWTTTEQKYSSLKNELVTTFDDGISYLQSKTSYDKENLEKFIREELEHFSDSTERRELMEEIDRISEIRKKIHCSCYRKKRIISRLSNYEDEQHFIYDLIVRLKKGEKIYACKIVNDEWMYGKITFSGDQLHIHCLSSTTIEKEVFVVSLLDVKKCIQSIEDLHLFIQIGNEKLIFTLTEELTIETLSLLKLFTGEFGQTLTDIKVEVDEFYSETRRESSDDSSETLNLNRCKIRLPNSNNIYGFEHMLYGKVLYKMSKGDVILQNLKEVVCFYKVPEMKSVCTFLNVVGKLHENCQIDFDEILDKRVEDSGICFSV